MKQLTARSGLQPQGHKRPDGISICDIWRVLAATACSATLFTGCSSLPSRLISPGVERVVSARSPSIAAEASPPAIAAATDAPTTLKMANPASPTVQMDRADLPDLWTRIRAGFALPEIESPEVERFAQKFAAMKWLERLGPPARRYLYLLVTEAEKRGLPTELALLPIIESGLNPQAQSPAAAVGLCQFIPSTGRRFGLHQSTLVDRRKDLVCINAMFEYLARNAEQFNGDWLLALAAYNWGEGAVAKAIDRNARLGLGGDYLSLRLPNETRAYVPQLLALKRLIASPERYGMTLPVLVNRPALDCNVQIAQDVDVTLAARLAGISDKEFSQINAGVSKGVIPRATHQTICLPLEAVKRFKVSVAEHKGAWATMTTYKLETSTTTAMLAKRYRTTPEWIRGANGVASGLRFMQGSTVLVPRDSDGSDISHAEATLGQLLMEADLPNTHKIVVRARRRDTLQKVASRHNIQLSDLQSWNSGARDPLKFGQRLMLHVVEKPAQATVKTASRSRNPQGTSLAGKGVRPKSVSAGANRSSKSSEVVLRGCAGMCKEYA